MNNQHRKISGYRELSAEEIALMNEIKAEGEVLKSLISKLRGFEDSDGRWVAIGETHLQQGIMALVRSVARPTTF